MRRNPSATTLGDTVKAARMVRLPGIRRAVLGDAPTLAELSQALGYPVPEDALGASLERLLGRTDHTVLVAEADSGKLVGWIHGAEHETLGSGRRCEILGLVVDSDHRRNGIGRRLVEAIEEWAAARGLEKIGVRSNVTRTASHPFYVRLGYVEIKTQQAYRKQFSLRVPPN